MEHPPWPVPVGSPDCAMKSFSTAWAHPYACKGCARESRIPSTSSACMEGVRCTSCCHHAKARGQERKSDFPLCVRLWVVHSCKYWGKSCILGKKMMDFGQRLPEDKFGRLAWVEDAVVVVFALAKFYKVSTSFRANIRVKIENQVSQGCFKEDRHVYPLRSSQLEGNRKGLSMFQLRTRKLSSSWLHEEKFFWCRLEW